MGVVNRLKNQNSALQKSLVESGDGYLQLLSKLREERLKRNPDISEICSKLQYEGQSSRNRQEQERMSAQLDDLCNIYDKIITGACDECEGFLQSIDIMEQERSSSRDGSIGGRSDKRGSSASPSRRIRPVNSLETDKYFTDLLHTSEKSNNELRQQVENLQREMNSREQKLFGEAMARLDGNNQDQMEKMKTQISELSQELSMLNVDNRALRERILKTENDNEILSKQNKDLSGVDKELKALQSNLDSQLAQNSALESKTRKLDLIRQEHSMICGRSKNNLIEARKKLQQSEEEVQVLRSQLNAAKDLQNKFDKMNERLHNQMSKLQDDNGMLAEEVSKIQREVGVAHILNSQDTTRQSEQDETIRVLTENNATHQQNMTELQLKLDSSEKQRQNANLKVKALRERLKTMQDSWQKISNDTESSFTALREQYQQQIKEYKSIIDSLKSQNSSLNSRIDSMKQVSSHNNTSKVSNLEQQASIKQQQQYFQIF